MIGVHLDCGVPQSPETLATIAAAGVCLVPSVATIGCAVAAATAYGFRAQMNIQRYGFSDSLTANLADVGLTTLTFVVGGAFAELAGSWGGVAGGIGAYERSAALTNMGRLFPIAYDLPAAFGVSKPAGASGFDALCDPI